MLFRLLKVPGDIETVSPETVVDDFLFDFTRNLLRSNERSLSFQNR